MLEVLHNALDPHEDKDCAILAVALTAFWCQCQLGELLGTSSHLFNPNLLPSRCAVSAPISDLGSRSIHLPCTKTHQTKGENVVLTTQLGRTNPVHTLDAHLHRSQYLDSSHYLFAFHLRNQQGFKILTKERFLARCNKIWSRAGFPKVSGHCFCMGGTTNLLKAGIAPKSIQLMGRWSSNAFFKYWRDTQDIAIQNAKIVGVAPASKQRPGRMVAGTSHPTPQYVSRHLGSQGRAAPPAQPYP